MKKLRCVQNLLFQWVKSQNLDIFYKIKIKNWTVLHIVPRFYSKINKFEVSRAFSFFVGQIEAPTEIVSEFSQPQISEFWEPWLSDKLKYTPKAPGRHDILIYGLIQTIWLTASYACLPWPSILLTNCMMTLNPASALQSGEVL